MITVGSLFSGIGGLEYGLEMTGGFAVKWQVEIDDYAQRVLAKHWPDVTRFRDIRECGAHNLAPVDLICGGFPCQPHSVAGKRKASADERDLWREFARVIRELRPRWVVAENVPGLLSSEDGRFFGRVLRDLAQSGYDAQWQCLRASDFGAPHQRERVFVVAYPNCDRQWDRSHQQKQGAKCPGTPDAGLYGELQSLAHTQSVGAREGRQTIALESGSIPLAHSNSRQHERSRNAWTGRSEPANSRELAYPDSTGQQECDPATVASEFRFACGSTPERTRTGQTQSRLGRDADGLSGRLDGHRGWPARPGERQYEWEPPRTVSGRQPNRNKRLKALGNAVVPQCAAYIGYRILATEMEVSA